MRGLIQRLPEGLSALRERQYVLYIIGQLASQVGNWLEVTAVSWIIYEMTKSPTLLGLNALFRVMPTLLLAVYGGTVADRLPRRRVLFVTESCMLVMSLTMGILAATGNLQYWHLYVLNLVSSTFIAFSVPARHALFGGLVPRSSLQSAVTLNSIAVRSAVFIGPTIAGLALAFGSYALPFFLNVLAFCAMLTALVAMRSEPEIKERAHRTAGTTEQMSEGVKFVWTSLPLRAALSFELASGLMGYNATLVTIIAHDVIGTGPGGLGFLLSSYGAGGFIAMLMMLTVPLQDYQRTMLTVGAGYVTLWAAIGLSQWLYLSATLLFILGTLDSVWGVTRNTLAQTLVPDHMRGRVMSIVMMTTRGSSQLGRVQSGLLVELIGATGAVLAGSAIIAGTLVAFWSQGTARRRREEEEQSLFPW
jgi:MFS family permease